MLNMIKSKKQTSYRLVKVTGIDGNAETFKRIKDAADAIGVTR